MAKLVSYKHLKLYNRHSTVGSNHWLFNYIDGLWTLNAQWKSIIVCDYWYTPVGIRQM